MEALYDGEHGAPLTVIGLLRPRRRAQLERRRLPLQGGHSEAALRDEFPRHGGLRAGHQRPDQGATRSRESLSAEEKMARGRAVIATLARYRRQARDEGDTRGPCSRSRSSSMPRRPRANTSCANTSPTSGYGYLETPQQLVPNVPLLFYSFRVMVGAGCLFILLLALVWWFNRRERLDTKRWLLHAGVWCIPLAYLASQAGWIVAEVGRQPWAIQGAHARERRRLEDPERLRNHDLHPLPRALHGTAHRRGEHPLPPNQDRTQKRISHGYADTAPTLLVVPHRASGRPAGLPALRAGRAGAALPPRTYGGRSAT